MNSKKSIKIALAGNPNVGKTSLFNALTGLNQHVGNYPGVTIEKKTGHFKLDDDTSANLTDLPGIYSIYPNSKDEEIALKILLDKDNKDYPDLVIVVAEPENLKRNLLLFSQIQNLGIPTMLCLNMVDEMPAKGIEIDVPLLAEKLKTTIIPISARKGIGMAELKNSIANYSKNLHAFFDITSIAPTLFEKFDRQYPNENHYHIWLRFQSHLSLKHLGELPFSEVITYPKKQLLQQETIKRYLKINEILKATYTLNPSKVKSWRGRLDYIFTHKFWGYAVFLLIMMVMYGSVFELASYPMDFIDEQFGFLSTYLQNILPNNKLTELITQGIIPGIGGVVIFIPQIAILFLLISILEETGYMSRAVFIMDRIMKPFGLNGKSVVPLVSGTACAIPAIMAARNIENPKERLITMLVTPFATCSARIPVYIIIISLIIPKKYLFGILPWQGLVMTAMYLLGFLAALVSGFILKKILRGFSPTYFIVEMPSYKWPMAKNVLLLVYEKVKSYLWGAGKIILSLSIILWFLGSHGPSKTFGNAAQIVTQQNPNKHPEELANKIAAYQVENSYIGIIGKGIEPLFRPLGYDWKISIAVLTSFAAREVFVGNLATLYALGNSGDLEENTIINKMKNEKKSDGSPRFDMATGISLLLFYAFAMQCLSTVAITKKETHSWKWTLIQLVFMTCFAYLAALLAYQILK